MRINFDMDGTIANLYGVDGWLEMLMAKDPTPYAIAKPLVNLSRLARYLNKIQKMGIEIGVISWLAKTSNSEYDKLVINAKKKWLAKHLPSVNWDNVEIVPYGTPKENYCLSENDILFDDEAPNRKNWKGQAFTEMEIFTTLKSVTLQTSFLVPRGGRVVKFFHLAPDILDLRLPDHDGRQIRTPQVIRQLRILI